MFASMTVLVGEQVGLERDLWLEFLAGRRFGLETAEGNLCGREESGDLNFQKREFLEVFWNRFYHPLFFKHSRLFDIMTAHKPSKLGVSFSGRTAVSKTANGGSIPSTPAEVPWFQAIHRL